MKNELQVIQYGDQKLIPIKPLCQMLGIDFKSQYEKLKSDKILSSTVVLSTSVGGDGKDREMVCLPFKYTFMWLSKIDARNVNEEARAGLIEAQTKAYDLLWNTLYSYQDYVERRNRIIEEQEIVRRAYKQQFNTAKFNLKESENELHRRLSITYEDYLKDPVQLELNFD